MAQAKQQHRKGGNKSDGARHGHILFWRIDGYGEM
jgi:hypothetical protein